MRFRETCDRTHTWFQALTPQARGWLSILILVSLAFALEPETRWPIWALRRLPWHLALGIVLSGLLGVAVRRAKSPSARFKLNGVALIVFVCMTGWGLSSENTLGWLSVGYLPLIFLASIAHRRAPTFVLGFLLAALAFCQFGNLRALLALGTFLLARDFDRVSLKRQSMTLLGTGLMAGFLVFSLSFDLAATFEYDPNYAIGFEYSFDRPRGFIGDAPIQRWTRMLTEALLIVACFAHLRGRTWGVLGLACLLPVLAVQIRATGIEYPFYSGLGLGCFSARHPLRDTVLEKSIALLAIGPWLWPMLHSLLSRSESSQHA